MTEVIPVPIAIAGLAAFAFGAAIAISILKAVSPVNEESEVHYLLAHDNDKTFPANSFRLVIVNQKKAWNKAVRVYSKGNSDWFEVKCGDSTGKVAKSNPDIKYDSTMVTFNGNDVNLECMKPGGLGVYSSIHSVKISAANAKDYIGNTVYVYFDNDQDHYFNNDAHKIGYDKLA